MKRLISISIAAIALSFSGLVYAQDPTDIADGARVWAKHCTRCHNARSPMERNDREWATIVAHMRARANLTRTEARQVKVYLQMINAAESTTALSRVTGETLGQSSPMGLGSASELKNSNSLSGSTTTSDKAEFDLRRLVLITRR